MRRLLVLILAYPLTLTAQPSNTGNWFIYFGNKKINNRWNWHHEAQYRNFNFVGDTEQLLLRTGLGYNLTENNNNVLLGYAFVYSEPYLNDTDAKTSLKEHRIYQQLISKKAFGRVLIQHRYRFEQRFMEKDFKLRLRYFLSLNIPLNQPQILDKTFYLSAYNEVFINTGSTFFDRNRLYGGLGYRLSKSTRIEAGIMNQSTSNNSRNQFNLITFVNF
jgi:hypothetical protein